MDFKVSEVYPNPFNPSAQLKFALQKNAPVNIAVYNMSGQLVEQLIDEHKSAGSYELKWNASEIGSGIYFFQVRAGDAIQTRKAILVR